MERKVFFCSLLLSRMGGNGTSGNFGKDGVGAWLETDYLTRTHRSDVWACAVWAPKGREGRSHRVWKRLYVSEVFLNSPVSIKLLAGHICVNVFLWHKTASVFNTVKIRMRMQIKITKAIIFEMKLIDQKLNKQKHELSLRCSLPTQEVLTLI